MRVFLLRHGEAVDPSPDEALNDDARELTPHGIENLTKACSTYARIIGTPRTILHSPLTRAQQSAAILEEALSDKVTMEEVPELRPNGRANRVVELLQEDFLTHSQDVVLVGHEPLLGDLLGLLSTGNDRLGIPMGKGMLAAIRFSDPRVMIGRLITLLNQDMATVLE